MASQMATPSIGGSANGAKEPLRSLVGQFFVRRLRQNCKRRNRRGHDRSVARLATDRQLIASNLLVGGGGRVEVRQEKSTNPTI